MLSDPNYRYPKATLIYVLTATLITLCCVACSDSKKKRRGGSCKTDEDCISGWICEERFCTPGERSASELAERRAAAKQAREAKQKKREAQRMVTKPGQGRISFKVCPYFRNVSSSVGSIIATHKQTKERHVISLQMETKKNEQRSEFTFYSLPLGAYEVYANYGIQVGGKFDTHRLKCDPKNTDRGCKGEELRVVEVVTPDKMPKTPLGCDWVVE